MATASASASLTNEQADDSSCSTTKASQPRTRVVRRTLRLSPDKLQLDAEIQHKLPGNAATDHTDKYDRDDADGLSSGFAAFDFPRRASKGCARASTRTTDGCSRAACAYVKTTPAHSN